MGRSSPWREIALFLRFEEPGRLTLELLCQESDGRAGVAGGMASRSVGRNGEGTVLPLWLALVPRAQCALKRSLHATRRPNLNASGTEMPLWSKALGSHQRCRSKEGSQR